MSNESGAADPALWNPTFVAVIAALGSPKAIFENEKLPAALGVEVVLGVDVDGDRCGIVDWRGRGCCNLVAYAA